MLFFIFHIAEIAVIIAMAQGLKRLNLRWFNAMGLIGRYAFVWGCISLVVSHTLAEAIFVAAVVLYGCSKAYGWNVVKGNILKSFAALKAKALEIWANRQ